jgi:F0F1-type ATP synthase delta subunit
MQTQKLAKILINMQYSKDLRESVANFLFVIKKNNLGYLLPSINKALSKIRKDEEEKNIEKIISPFLLEDTTEKELKEKYDLENTEQVIDKKMIAGFKIYTRNKIVDASLSTILKNFTK